MEAVIHYISLILRKKINIARKSYSFLRIMRQILKIFGKLRDAYTEDSVCLCLRNLTDTPGVVTFFLPAYQKHISFQPDN